MKFSCISAIVRKDTLAALRNKLVLLALVGGVMFSVLYYILPSDVEETFDLAVYGESRLFSEIGDVEEGIAIDFFSSEEAVREAVGDGDYISGIVLPENFDSQLLSGQKPEVVLYFSSEQPESVRTSIEYLLQLAFEYGTSGEQPLEMKTEILGEDMAGKHIPLREQSVALYLMFALVMEMWTISTLIVEESAAGTLRAVLVTPASPSDVVMSKGIVGIAYSSGVALAILVLTWSLRGSLPVLFLGIILGAVLAVSIGLFLGSLTTDITGSFIYVSVPMLVLILPGLLIFIPDVSLSAVKVIPTYYLVDAFNQVLNYGAQLKDIWKDFFVIIICDVAFFFLGIFALRRRYS
jgi:ABC-2 type transport system permease protein